MTKDLALTTVEVSCARRGVSHVVRFRIKGLRAQALGFGRFLSYKGVIQDQSPHLHPRQGNGRPHGEIEGHGAVEDIGKASECCRSVLGNTDAKPYKGDEKRWNHGAVGRKMSKS